MKKSYHLNTFFVIITSIFFSNSFAQLDNTVSTNPDPYCLGLTYTSNASGDEASDLEPGNDYDCLGSQPNPSWFFLKAEVAGPINLELSAPNDIDFILYGPFSNYNDLLNNAGSLTTPIACSYSSSSVETINIPSMNAGDYYLILVTNYSGAVQEISLVELSGTGSLDCSIYGDTIFHTISGNAFYDINENGTQQPGEYFLPNVNIQFDPMNVVKTTNLSGEFEYIYYTSDSVYYTLTSEMTDWSNTSPSQIGFYLDSNNTDTTGLLFGFHPDSLYYLNELDIINSNTVCVGTNITWVNVSNGGTLHNAGVVHVNLDAELTFASSNYPTDSIVGNNIYFSFDTLLPFHQLSIQILSNPATTLFVGDTISNFVDLTIIDSMLNVQNVLSDFISTAVNCSYDPNYKASFPNGALGFTNIITPTDELEYMIHFQNTGTAPAVNVQIEDTLSLLLDESTFEFLSSSHNAFVSIDSNRLVTFDFPNINLPDSATNEPMSHGYVKFRIALSSTVLPNDEVTNGAQIYFDYNAAIVTNSTLNILSCFTAPTVSLDLMGSLILTTVSPGTNTFMWLFESDTLVGETNNFLACTADGIYTVIVTNEYGCQITESITYIFAETGLSNINSTNLASIFPNPSENNFGIYFAETGNYQINVTDESGKLIFSDLIQESNKYTIDGNSLPAGIYFIQIKQDENVSSFYKIVKL